MIFEQEGKLIHTWILFLLSYYPIFIAFLKSFFFFNNLRLLQIIKKFVLSTTKKLVGFRFLKAPFFVGSVKNANLSLLREIRADG